MNEISTIERSGKGSLIVSQDSNSLEEIRMANAGIKEKIQSAANYLGIEISFTEHIKIEKERNIKDSKKLVKYSHKLTTHFKDTHYMIDAKTLLEYKTDETTLTDKIKNKVRDIVIKKYQKTPDSDVRPNAVTGVRG